MQQHELLVELAWVCLVTEISVWPEVNSRHILQMSENRIPFITSHLSHILCVIWWSVSHWKNKWKRLTF